MLPVAWTLCWSGVSLSWHVQPLCGLPAAQSQGGQLGCGIARYFEGESERYAASVNTWSLQKIHSLHAFRSVDHVRCSK